MAAGQIHLLLLDLDEARLAEMKKSLSGETAFKVVGETTRWEEAAAIIEQRSPHAIFSSPFIEKRADLGWIDEVPSSVAVVLVASHPRHAFRAFEKRVLDYLLKPFSVPRLELTVARLKEWQARRPASARSRKKILIQSRRESFFISPQSISCIRAEGNYTSVTMLDGSRRLVHRSLRQWKELLPRHLFFQIHRSTLINLEQVHQLEKGKGGELLRLAGQEEALLVSRRMATQLKQRLKN